MCINYIALCIRFSGVRYGTTALLLFGLSTVKTGGKIIQPLIDKKKKKTAAAAAAATAIDDLVVNVCNATPFFLSHPLHLYLSLSLSLIKAHTSTRPTTTLVIPHWRLRSSILTVLKRGVSVSFAPVNIPGWERYVVIIIAEFWVPYGGNIFGRALDHFENGVCDCINTYSHINRTPHLYYIHKIQPRFDFV